MTANLLHQLETLRAGGHRTTTGWRNAVAGLAVLVACAVIVPRTAWAEAPAHGIAMHGKPALPAGFSHLPYANPDAPKGGTVRFGQLGTFDSLNPLNIFGVAAHGIREYVYESLLARSLDEPFSLYGLVARAVEMPDDRRSVTFHIDPDARFSDATPVTADDVRFSWELLKEKGQPFHRSHYKSVDKAEVLAPDKIRFTFEAQANREAPLLLGLMPILPRHAMTPEHFERTTFKPPIGSGPYVVAEIDPGRSLSYKANPHWWGRNKPVNRGRFNPAEIRYEYFRDQTTFFEAFKVGTVDLRFEDDAGRWAEGYDFPAVADGRIKRLEVPTGLPAGMNAIVMNSRRPLFADRRVREAMILMLDFEWINKSLFHGHFTRTESFFARSELASAGRPADARERALLAPFANTIKPAILDGTHKLPVSDGLGHNRQNLGQAFALLKEAGYVNDGGRLVHGTTKAPFAFEMLAASRTEERLFQAFAKPLERLGIQARIRLADSAQRWQALRTFDFDVIQWTWAQSLSPGNEQFNRWGSQSADVQLSLNYAGIREPAVDAMIEAVLAAREREEFTAAVRALDRVLLAGDFVIPLYHPKAQWIAHWKRLKHPERFALSGFTFDTWWVDSPR